MAIAIVLVQGLPLSAAQFLGLPIPLWVLTKAVRNRQGRGPPGSSAPAEPERRACAGVRRVTLRRAAAAADFALLRHVRGGRHCDPQEILVNCSTVLSMFIMTSFYR